MSSLERLSDTALSGSAAGASSGQVLTKQTSGRFSPGAGISDNPVYGTHNLNPSSLKYSAAALAACRLGVRDFRLATFGDSIPGGGNATNTVTDVYWRRAATILAAKMGLTCRAGLVPVNQNAAGINPQFTLGTGWTTAGLNALGQSCPIYTIPSGSAGILDFTPTDDAGVAIQCDSFIIYNWGPAGGGGFQWAIDGGTYTTQSPTGSISGVNPYTVSAGARGFHTLHIKSLATGNGPLIAACEAVDSQARGIRYMGGGQAGATTPATFTGTGGPDTVQAFGPDLVMFEWGTNEYGSQTSLATYQTNAQTVAATPGAWTRPADVLWTAPPPQSALLTIPQSSYYAALDAAADTAGFPVLHIDRRWVSYAVSNASPLSLYGDGTHPNTTGHNAYGAAVAAILSLL